MKKNLALIGMSGTLKSTVGRRLAKKLQLLFIDTDDMIEFETGQEHSGNFRACRRGLFPQSRKKAGSVSFRL